LGVPMKKLFPEASDVPGSVANRAARIIEKHLRLHRVDRARDLPEEAKVRLYRDLRFFFDSGGQPTQPGTAAGGVRRFLAGLWGKIEDFVSMSESEGWATRTQLGPACQNQGRP
jgi:hypothetical protein